MGKARNVAKERSIGIDNDLPLMRMFMTQLFEKLKCISIYVSAAWPSTNMAF